jgi:hypothetical protein
VQVITEDDEFPADTFVISIPFDKSKSQAGNTVKRLYGKALEERGRVPRLSQFNFSRNPKTGKEHLVYSEKMRTYLAYAQEIYLPITNTGSNISPKELLEKSIDAFEKIKVRKRSFKRGRAKNALIEQVKLFENEFNALQQIGRMNTYVENILVNVATGVFPGEYNKKRKPTKLKIVKLKVGKVSRSKTTITSTRSRYLQNKRIDGVNPYGSWTPTRRAAHEKRKAEKEAAKKKGGQ